MARSLKLVLLGALALAACSSVGPSGRAVGAPCNPEGDSYCDELCLVHPTYKTGVMCTLRCVTDADCVGGTACSNIRLSGGDRTCAPTCETDAECAPYNRGLTCVTVGTGKVCVDPSIETASAR